MTEHPFGPLYSARSNILILGSFPSVKSREVNFFYGHPQNRFWSVISGIYGKRCPVSLDEKRDFILSHGLALWDVIGKCNITGSSDSSIKDVVPNDISVITDNAPIKKIYTNGLAAKKYYDKYIKNTIGLTAAVLPSTSPANAAWSLERLTEEWKKKILLSE